MDSVACAQLNRAFNDPAQRYLQLMVGTTAYQVDLDKMSQTSPLGYARPICCVVQDGTGKWQWVDESGSWEDYDTYVAGQLSAARAAKRNTTRVFVSSRSQWYVVDLLRFEQHNAFTLASKRIRFFAPPNSAPLASGVKKRRTRTATSTASQNNVASATAASSTTVASAASASATATFTAASAAAPTVGSTTTPSSTASGCPSLTPLYYQADSLTDMNTRSIWTVLKPGEWEHDACDPVTFLQLGEEDETVVRLPCSSSAISCTFNKTSIEQSLLYKSQCPTCGMTIAIPGPQPSGSMHISIDHTNDCDGHLGVGTIVISYHFPSGTQGRRDPSPGLQYQGTHRTCYYPNAPVGWSCLRLLRLAFERGQLFHVGDSVTTGQTNVVVWAGIHQKTTTSGGATQHGWPDDGCLGRLQSEVASKGISHEES